MKDGEFNSLVVWGGYQKGAEIFRDEQGFYGLTRGAGDNVQEDICSLKCL